MKKILISIIFLLVAVTCQPQIPATVEIKEDTTATGYWVCVSEFSDPVNNPLIEDTTLVYIKSVADTSYFTTTALFQFQTQANGNYIMVAAFVVNSFGTAGATLSELVLKGKANKAIILRFEL